MKTTICTLFEGNYHYGVAALTNSLYQGGYRGKIYAGYRGALPKWTAKARRQVICKWDDALVLDVADDLQIIFISLTTDYHLTNYKPDFMLELIDGPEKEVDAIYYFDPDICVIENWSFFAEWVSCGVALCEDVNSPLPANHPRRLGWRKYFSEYDFNLRFKSSEYINGGFIGVGREHFNFLKLWQTMQLAMSEQIGGLAASKLTKGKAYKHKGFANCFDASDQDALNAAMEATDCELSIIGKEAMGFKIGGAIMPHALGAGKPWQRIYLIETIKGFSPRLVDKLFWKNVSNPIECYKIIEISMHSIDLFLSSIIARFYRKT